MPKHILIKISTADGKVLAEINAGFNAPAAVFAAIAHGTDAIVPMAIAISIAPISFGVLSLDIWADNSHQKSIPFNIIQ